MTYLYEVSRHLPPQDYPHVEVDAYFSIPASVRELKIRVNVKDVLRDL